MQIKDMKIGIIGLGSIGMRHATELLSLGVENIFALRTNKGSKDISKEVEKNITNVFLEKEFLELNLDGYIISNPTSLHIEALKLVKNKNKPIFIEKPFSSSLSEMKSIKNIKYDNIQIGFCLRFHEVAKRVKEIIKSKQLGQIYHSRLNVGQYLPSWHPYTDYRTEYFSKKELGGGAIRTLSHEIDLAIHFFGEPTSFKTFKNKVSNLEINVDDYTLLLLQYKNHLSRIEIDFLNKKKERNGIIFGTKADLHYDFFENTIKIYDTNTNLILDEIIPKENMYHSQMVAFLNLISTNKLEDKISTFEQNILIQTIIENE